MIVTLPSTNRVGVMGNLKKFVRNAVDRPRSLGYDEHGYGCQCEREDGGIDPLQFPHPPLYERTFHEVSYTYPYKNSPLTSFKYQVLGVNNISSKDQFATPLPLREVLWRYLRGPVDTGAMDFVYICRYIMEIQGGLDP